MEKMSTVKEKEICTVSDAVMISESSDDPPTPFVRSLRPEDPRAPSSPCRSSEGTVQGCARARLERHRSEMAGRVCVPDAWGQEGLLQSWVDCSAFERFLPEGLALARAALVEDCWQASPRRLVDDLRRGSPSRMEIENRC